MTPMGWADATPIALVVPGDCQVDDEFWRMLAPHAIPFVSRTTGADERMQDDRTAVAHLVGLARSSDLEVAADRLRDVHAVAAAYVDTSISFVRGPGGDLDIARRIASVLEVPTIVTSTAVVVAARALGVRRVAVLSVYPPSVNATIAPFFDPQGVEIVRIRPLDVRMAAGATSEALAHLPPEALVAAGQAADGPDIDAVFIPCTAVRTLDAIEPLEAAIGKPVITAIQATIWTVARLAGVTDDTPLGGRLWNCRALPPDAGVTMAQEFPPA
jgi:maleate cis-trans isomerase